MGCIAMAFSKAPLVSPRAPICQVPNLTHVVATAQCAWLHDLPFFKSSLVIV